MIINQEGKMKKYFLTLFLTLLFSVSLVAQERDMPPPPEEDSPHKMIKAIKIWKLMEILDLDEEQMIKFFPRLKKIEKQRRSSFKKRRKLLGELKELLGEEKSDKKILNVIKKIIEFDKKKRKEEENLRKEVMLVLSVKQQAKFLLFEERFEEEIRKIIKGLRKEKGMGPRHEKKF